MKFDHIPGRYETLVEPAEFCSWKIESKCRR